MLVKLFMKSILILFVVSNLNLITQENRDIKGIKILELSAEELLELGVQVDGNKVSYNEKSFDGTEILLQTVEVKDMLIQKKNFPAPKEVKEFVQEQKIALPPRLVVNKFKSGSTAYFFDKEDLLTFNTANDDEPDVIVHKVANINKLIGVHIRLKNDNPMIETNDIYLWYRNIPESLDKLPDRYKEDIYEEERITEYPDTETYTNEWREKNGIITGCRLYPNPTQNGPFALGFYLKENRNISFALHDMSGAYISELNRNHYDAGEQEVTLILNDIAAGMYLISMTTDKGEQVVQRLIVIN